MTVVESQAPQTPATQRMLWRGAMYEALALAFSYPDEETVADLGASLEGIIEHEVTSTAPERQAIEALSAALAATDPETLAVWHSRYFAGEVPCSTCETEYEADAFAKARQVADVAGFYHAFGLKVPADRPTPADSIATELEFLSHSVMRQALAAVNGWDEQRQVCEEAQRAFLEDHPGRWVPLFCRSLLALDGAEEFYGAAATLCEQFIAAEVQAAGAKPRPAVSRCSAAGDGEAFSCMFAAEDEEDKEVLL